MIDRLRDDSSISNGYVVRPLGVAGAHHCMRFTAACLPIGEHCSVVTTNDGLYQAKATLIVHFLLLRVCAIDRVECERPPLRIFRIFGFPDSNLAELSIHRDDFFAAYQMNY